MFCMILYLYLYSSYNNLVSFEEKERRIITYYMPYHMILNQAMEFLRPKYVLSSHSFTPQYEDNPKREYEVGILFRERNLLVDKVYILKNKI
jgi:predicted N-formylglutamate amidohydrolase